MVGKIVKTAVSGVLCIALAGGIVAANVLIPPNARHTKYCGGYAPGDKLHRTCRQIGNLKGVCLANSSYLREWFALHEVPVYLETTLKEVKDGCIICTGKDGEVTIPCDSVICSAGYLPAPIAKEGGKVHLVGDCRKVGNLRSVIWRAYEVAMAIK